LNYFLEEDAMKTETGFDEHFVTLRDDVQIRYFTAGNETGKPVVLLHGGGTDHAMLSWRDTIPALTQAGYRIYAPNYPGYGGSPFHPAYATTEKMLDVLAQLMDTWGLEKAALIGISMGGGLAIGYTLQHQERVEKLVLIGSYGIQDKAPYHALSYFMIRMPWVMNATWAMSRGSRWAARYSLESIIRNPQSRSDALLNEVLAAMQNLDSQKAFGIFQQDEISWNGTKTNYTPMLGEIKIPALLIHGTHDIGVPLKYAQRAAGLFPNARLAIIENAGHWTQRDYPEKVNEQILDFLAG
jgi:pimeloyl-ACP methyl ester carboxylesterase